MWEESIIMMPKTARFVFLSATIPNAREFAEWIATIHRRASGGCNLVTSLRHLFKFVTPLRSFIFCFLLTEDFTQVELFYEPGKRTPVCPKKFLRQVEGFRAGVFKSPNPGCMWEPT